MNNRLPKSSGKNVSTPSRTMNTYRDPRAVSELWRTPSLASGWVALFSPIVSAMPAR